MKAIKIIFLISSLFVFNAFAQDTNKETVNKSETNKPLKIEDKSNEVIQIDKSMIPVASSQRANDKYRIGFQDVLTINVFNVYGQPKFTQTVSVGQDGTISLPRLTEPVVAVCKTERQLAKLVTELYKNYLRSPYVNIRTLEQRSQPFAVIGAVNKPGNFYLKEKVRLLRLISLAGGQDVENSGSRIQVARIGNAAGCTAETDADSEYQFFAYTLNDVLTGKENPWMQPGDIVSVLEASQAYVIGEVFKPTKITLKEPTTLTQALADAGGVSSTAKTSQVVIQRKESGGVQRKEMVFDLKEIRANKIQDPFLEANDIVVVSSSTTKKVKKGIWDLIKTGLPNIFYRINI